jgi:protein-S-isoprenylcysteine O-methyltransferase Ste14
MLKSSMIHIGNFFFRYRNGLFPIIIVVLVLSAIPSTEISWSELLDTLKDSLGVAITLAGLAFRGWVIGYVYIKRGGLNKQVYAHDLVTDGIFGICRNPLYVGNMLIYIGVFVLHGNPYVMVLGTLSFAFIYQCIVYAEENFLRNKFGAGYDAYCRDTPRWLPRFSKFRTATQGMHFNFRKVIIKDYSTMATSILALTVVEGYEQVDAYVQSPATYDNTGYVVFLVAVVLCCGLMAGAVRVMKKRQWLVETMEMPSA